MYFASSAAARRIAGCFLNPEAVEAGEEGVAGSMGSAKSAQTAYLEIQSLNRNFTAEPRSQ